MNLGRGVFNISSLYWYMYLIQVVWVFSFHTESPATSNTYYEMHVQKSIMYIITNCYNNNCSDHDNYHMNLKLKENQIRLML